MIKIRRKLGQDFLAEGGEIEVDYLIDRGSPRVFRRVGEAGDVLIDDDAHIFYRCGSVDAARCLRHAHR